MTWVAGELRGVNCRTTKGFDHLQHVPDDRVHIEARAIEDDRVFSGPEGSDGPSGIRLVARLNLGEELVVIDLDPP